MNAYTPEESSAIFTRVCELIQTGKSLRQIFREEQGLCDIGTFYDWLNDDESKYQQYACATEIRAEKLFDEILEIADETDKDVIITEDGPQTQPENINRSRLRVDARKWVLSKMIPKKYGDRIDQYIDHTTKGEKLPAPVIQAGGTPPLADSENSVDV